MQTSNLKLPNKINIYGQFCWVVRSFHCNCAEYTIFFKFFSHRIYGTLYVLHSDLNFRPFSADKPQGTEHQPEELVGDDAHPDSVNAKVQHVTADVGYDRTDEGDADAGADHRVNHVACAAQAAGENDLADLEQDDDRDRAGDADTDCDDLLFPEEQTVERPAK